MRNLIITADDYGMSTSVNDAIDACLEGGALRATCVMVNMPVCQAASVLRQRFPHCSVGIHWTLTQGRPVSSPSSVPSLVNASGEFHRSPEFRRKWFLGKISKSDVRTELKAQYDRLLAIAGRPQFWNTHQNIHVLPGLFQYFVEIGREVGIPAMRCHRRVTVPMHSTANRYYLSHPLYWIKGEIVGGWSRSAEQKQVQMPDGRIYMPGYKNTNATTLLEIVDRVPWLRIRRAVEIVVHPATRVEEGLFGRLTESRVREYETLRDPALAYKLRKQGINLVGFEAVLKSA